MGFSSSKGPEMKNLFVLFTLVSVVVLQSCNTKKETTIIERQAPANINDSLKIQSHNKSLQTVTIKKSSLQKAFMMTPTVIVAERVPQFNDFRPVIVSFEKAGGKIGLFRLASDNIYSSIPTDKLLQTFDIISETDDEITFDLSIGLKGLILEPHINIVSKDSFKEANDNATNGRYSGLNIEESIIKKVELDNNTIYIEQAIKISSLEVNVTKNEDYSDDDQPKTQSVSKKNSNLNVLVELKPYIINTNFKSKLYDQTQRIGYFINFATAEKVDYVLPQIMKWDLSEEKGPITVAIEKTIPADIKQAVIEGVLYWNKVIGRDVLKIQEGFSATDRLKDRMIVTRWVQWDSAGFAYASIQADPITGESLRAQVFMTSSWLNHAKKTYELPTDVKKLSGFCLFEESKLDLTKIYTQVSAERRNEITKDVIRMVVAHEMGHVMGLRHNFAGSMNHEGTDQDLIQAEDDYLKKNNHPGYAFSTTVMDYERSIHTGLMGAIIKTQQLPYDKAAIDWGYFDAPITLSKNSYCSDEHLGLAESAGAEIYGCQIFDAYKNIILDQTIAINSAINFYAQKTFNSVLTNNKNTNPYTKKSNIEELAASYNSVQPEFNTLDKFLFSKARQINLVSIDQTTNPFVTNILNMGNPEFYEGSAAKTAVKADLKELGGLSGIMRSLLEKNNPTTHTYEKQVINFFEVLDPANTELSVDQISTIKTKMLETAKIMDVNLENEILKEFIPVKKEQFNFLSYKDKLKYIKDPSSIKRGNIRYSDSLHIGNPEDLINSFQKPFVVKSETVKTVKFNDQEIKVQLSVPSSDDILVAFQKLNWPATVQSEISPAIDKAIINMKSIAAQNTLELIKLTQGLAPTELNFKALNESLEKIPFDKVTGITKYELQAELKLIEKIENLKPIVD